MTIAKIEIGPKPDDLRIMLSNGDELVCVTRVQPGEITPIGMVTVDLTALVRTGASGGRG